MTAADARRARAAGADLIVVSNHGGRQLDGVPATLDSLPEVADAVSGRVEVYLDGGVRWGADVLKVGHHGSRTSSSRAFLAAVRPQEAIISVGRRNRFGHPHPSTLEALAGQISLTD